MSASCTKNIIKLAFSTLTALALMTSLVACRGDDSDVSQVEPGTSYVGNSAIGPGVTITADKDTFDHKVGETDCPQPIGTITIKNIGHDEELTFKLTRGHELEKATSVDVTTGKVAKGAEGKVQLVFNCSQTFDVAEQWIVEVYKADGTRIADTAINIKGKVNNG